jgi:CxxC motif-containing protein
MEKNLICISCPRGCEIQTSLDGSGAITRIEGNFCKLGVSYAESEIRDPKRIFTSTVRVINGKYPLVPVWTEKPVPKDKIKKLIELTREIEVAAPVKKGQEILKNVFGLGVSVTATRSMKKAGYKRRV